MTARPPFLADEAERAALGAALVNEAALALVCRDLRPTDMYREREQRILAAMLAMHGEERPVDVVSVATRLGAEGELRDYLHSLAEFPPIATNASEYIGAVQDHARRRRLQLATEVALAELAHGDGEGARLFCERMTAAVEAERVTSVPAVGNAFIAWPSFWDRDSTQAEWVYPDVLARGRGHALYAAHKLGKSLLMLFIAAKLATGSEPNVVIYLDYEMSEADVFDRLEDMGYGPDTDLSRLHYVLLPTLPPLDTAEGSRALMELVDHVRGEWPDHHTVVMIDTISRAVCGEENDSDTFRDFHAHTGIEFKRRGITWARLDHSGKDPTKGQRGTSSKGDDVDLVWGLTRTENGVCLRRDVARMPWVPEKVTFHIAEDPLTFTRLAGDWPAGTGETANLLDRLEVPLEATVRTAQAALKAVDEGRRQLVIRAALTWRRECPGEAP